MAETSSGGGKGAGAFRTIGEVSDEIGVPQHVLRFWETKFPAIKPLKRGGNRRYYRPEDVELIRAINRLLYTDGYTIRGVQKLVAERGTGAVVAAAPEPAAPAPTDRLSQLRAIRDRLAAGLAEARAA